MASLPLRVTAVVLGGMVAQEAGMPLPKRFFLVIVGLLGVFVLGGCSNAVSVNYRPLKGVADLGFPAGATIGVLRLQDERPDVVPGDRKSQSNVLAQNASSMYLTYQSAKNIPVADLVQDVLARELGSGGLLVAKLAALSEVGPATLLRKRAASEFDYLIGGSVERFQLVGDSVSTQGLYCVSSVVLRISIVADDGTAVLDNERVESHFHKVHRSNYFIPDQNADQLVNHALRNAIRQLLRRMAARLEAARTSQS